MKTILITGGCGFIGSSLVRKIVTDNLFKVINVDNLTYAGNLESLNEIRGSENYFFEKVDISDFNSLKDVFFKHKPNYVMHLAAESHVDRSISNSDVFISTNIIGTHNLLKCSHQLINEPNFNKDNFRFHHISTDEVYGDLEDGDFFTEDTSYKPSSPYSASKASSDHLVRAWGRTYKLPILITNCSNNYGPYHFPEKLIPNVIIRAMNEENIHVYGDGSQIRDWLYVEDHVQALLSVISSGKIGETYNIGGNNEKTNLEVVNIICDLLEKHYGKNKKKISNYKELITFVDDRPGHDTRYAIDSTKIRKELNWVPSETFETGIEKTVKWYIDNKSWWESLI